MTTALLRPAPPLLPILVVLACLGALAIAFGAQHWGGLAPCVLCVWQRWAYGAALALGAAALALPRWRRPLLLLAGLAFLAVAGIAFFHVGVEAGWWRGSSECQGAAIQPGMTAMALKQAILTAPVVSCDAVPWSFLGLSIAGWNLVFSLGFAAATVWGALRWRRTA